MKKVAIITICDNNNYGNRLQNYALQKVVNDLGVKSVTLWNNNENTIKYKIKLFAKWILSYKNIKYKRMITFSKFTNRVMSNKYVNFDNMSNLNNEFDYFIVGSDQIWNYSFGCAEEKDFLQFAKYDKTISYAPSFGVSTIDNEWKDKICKGINHIKYLSVREDKGADIIKELTDRDASVLLDPTLLLSKDDWNQLQKKPKKMIKEKYILTYFLGRKSEKLNKEIHILSKYNNLKIINLCDIEDKQFYSCDPSEFLYLFNNAEIVLTDSFHACIFSIIYNKPFFVFDRNSEGVKCMNSRLDTLLKTFKQEERKVKSLDNIDNIFLCDYSESYKILKEKQMESLAFLENALNISEYNGEVVNG